MRWACSLLLRPEGKSAELGPRPTNSQQAWKPGNTVIGGPDENGAEAEKASREQVCERDMFIFAGVGGHDHWVFILVYTPIHTIHHMQKGLHIPLRREPFLALLMFLGGERRGARRSKGRLGWNIRKKAMYMHIHTQCIYLDI